MVNTLRGLRDDFQGYAMLHRRYDPGSGLLTDPGSLGDMYELLDNYVCWLGAMDDADSRNLIARATHTAAPPPMEADIATMIALNRRVSGLLRAVCHWWLTTKTDPHMLSGQTPCWQSVVSAPSGKNVGWVNARRTIYCI